MSSPPPLLEGSGFSVSAVKKKPTGSFVSVFVILFFVALFVDFVCVVFTCRLILPKHCLT